MAITSASQAEYGGSIPLTRSTARQAPPPRRSLRRALCPPPASPPYIVATQFGRIGVWTDGARLLRLGWAGANEDGLLRPPDRVAARAALQLARYCDDPEYRFDLPVAPARTPFEKAFRATLRAVGAGNLCTYGELAARLGSGPRAVGRACARNPLLIIVPCHRVVAAAGLGGYSGRGGRRDLGLKRRLIAHEASARR